MTTTIDQDLISNLGLMVSLGFLGGFGHCLGMCGPLSTALLLSAPSRNPDSDRFTLRQLQPVLLLNLGRILSYSLVGALMGSVGSVVIAGGQNLGLGSPVRQGIAIVTGGIMIFFGLSAIGSGHLPQHPFTAKLHHLLNQSMKRTASPFGLGLLWGLMPCGFLYMAQLKAAESLDPIVGALTMTAFGLGTLPIMGGVGSLMTKLSHNRRGQLFQMGGFLTLIIGLLTLFRSSEMVDFTGHGAIVFWMLSLVARPLGQLWPWLLNHRRGLGVSAGLLAIAHSTHMLAHSLNWNLTVVTFLSPWQKTGFALGLGALLVILPPLWTSFNGAMQWLGRDRWNRLHSISLPGLVLALFHTLILGSNYLGNQKFPGQVSNPTLVLLLTTIVFFSLRSNWVWSWFGQEARYNDKRGN